MVIAAGSQLVSASADSLEDVMTMGRRVGRKLILADVCYKPDGLMTPETRQRRSDAFNTKRATVSLELCWFP